MSILNHLIQEYRQKLTLYNQPKSNSKTLIRQSSFRNNLPKLIQSNKQKTQSNKNLINLSNLTKDIQYNNRQKTSVKSLSILNGGQKSIFKNQSKNSRSISNNNISIKKSPIFYQSQPRFIIPTLQDSFSANNNNKFKKLTMPSQSVTIQQMFPLPKIRGKAKSLQNIYAKHNNKSLGQFIRQQFHKNRKVSTFVYFKYTSLKYWQISFPFPYNINHEELRKQYKKLQEQVENALGLRNRKRCYFFDVEGYPINSLSEMIEHNVILVSLLPKLQYILNDKMRQFCNLQNEKIQFNYGKQKINLSEFINTNQQRQIQRNKFITQYCNGPQIKIVYQNNQQINDLENINNLYKKIQNIEPDAVEMKNLYFNPSPKKKDFTNTQINFLKSKIQTHHIQNLSKKQKNIKLILPKSYKLNHHQLISKIPKNHNLILKSKFNRVQLLRLKSIYNSILSLNLKKYIDLSQVLKFGIQKEFYLQTIGKYGFEISQNLLKQILKHDKFIDWERFLIIMQTLVHKHSNESIDEYLCTIGNPEQIEYGELIKIIRYGLERLFILKDSFYDGFDEVYAKQIFEHLGKDPQKQEVNRQQLKKLLDKNKTFQYIFFQ